MNETRSSGASDHRRLGFFVAFMRMAGLLAKDVADDLKVTRPSIAHWLRVDDARLNDIVKVVTMHGYNIEFMLLKQDENYNVPVKVIVKDSIALPGENYEPDNMAFLLIAMRRYSFTMMDISRRLGLQYSTVRFWFSRGTKISRICQIAEAFDLKLEICISAKVERVCSTAGSVIHCSYHQDYYGL